MKKKHYVLFVILLIFIAVTLITLYSVPNRIVIDKTIPCTEVHTQSLVNVKIQGVYYQYFLRNDHFIGSIEIDGKRECARDFMFENDRESCFIDEYGQPYGSIIQRNIFEFLSIAENTYIIVSQ